MTYYQPVHAITGQRGPLFRFASGASLWIFGQPDAAAWHWEAVAAAKTICP